MEGRGGVKGSLRRAKSRALDTAPTFQQTLLRWKRREGGANPPVAPACRARLGQLPPNPLGVHPGQEE